MPTARTPIQIKRDSHAGLVLGILERPMTATELLSAMRPVAPKIQLRSLWRILVGLQKRGIVTCLNPRAVKVRLYFLTPKGRRWLQRNWGISLNSFRGNLDWRDYAYVARGPMRRQVLLVMEKPWKDRTEKSASEVRKLLLASEHPMGLADTIKLLHGLKRRRIIRRAGVTEKRSYPLYELTTRGERIIEEVRERGHAGDMRTPPVNSFPSNSFKAEELPTDNGTEN